jgi:hypothetical protein
MTVSLSRFHIFFLFCACLFLAGFELFGVRVLVETGDRGWLWTFPVGLVGGGALLLYATWFYRRYLATHIL